MNRDEVRRMIRQELEELAPEADLASLDPNADIREELDIDSFDFARFLTRLSEAMARDIPDEDFNRLTTLAGAEAYFDE